MRKNTTSKIVLGYYDEDGYTYCIKHAMDKSDAIIDNHKDNCCICGAPLDPEHVKSDR